jgi:hypothetical protein
VELVRGLGETLVGNHPGAPLRYTAVKPWLPKVRGHPKYVTQACGAFLESLTRNVHSFLRKPESQGITLHVRVSC